MAGNRYYYYDQETCTFLEIKTGRKKLVYQVVAVLVTSIFLTGLLMWGVDEIYGTPQELALENENEFLQEQLKQLESRLEAYAQQLNEFAETDQNLYRTLLEADPIPEDVRQVGVGGSDPYESFSRFGLSTAGLLRETSRKLDKLERQISLQSSSYRELSKLAEERKNWMAELPAIIPADGPIVSGFGLRIHPILRVRKMHEGVDVLVRTGSPVVASGNGVVREAGQNPTFGKHVIIEHKTAGYRTLYAHLSEIAPGIRPGKKVERGEKIGLSGNTGRSTGPHLHYEVHDLEGNPINPVHFFAPSLTPQRYQALLKAAEESNIALD
jgi:murein DD-endopeptidase MepM/ murein hydrolase activator NlpD